MAINKTVTDLTTLKINYLTEAQYNDAVLNDEINENEIYMTPSSGAIELGYEVEDTTETLVDTQTVSCTTSYNNDTYKGTIIGNFNFADYSSITVKFEGHTYTCPYNSSDGSYGAVYSGGEWSSDYPFQICYISQVLSLLVFLSGSYSIEITAGDITVTTTSDFDNAVKHSRGIHISSSTPTSSDGEDGDLWLTY